MSVAGPRRRKSGSGMRRKSGSEMHFAALACGAGKPFARNASLTPYSAAAQAASVGVRVSAAGPSQGANCAPCGGSAAAQAASVGVL